MRGIGYEAEETGILADHVIDAALSFGRGLAVLADYIEPKRAKILTRAGRSDERCVRLIGETRREHRGTVLTRASVPYSCKADRHRAACSDRPGQGQ
jgi:hypothetical protein